MGPHTGKFSIVTGASSGIGLELAKCCAKDGMDILIVADEPEIHQASRMLLRTRKGASGRAQINDRRGS